MSQSQSPPQAVRPVPRRPRPPGPFPGLPRPLPPETLPPQIPPDFPEDRLQVLNEYLPVDDDGVSKLGKVESKLASSITTDVIDVTTAPSNRTALDVNTARKVLQAFLGHPSQATARSKLGLAENEGAFAHIIDGDFDLALTDIAVVPRDANLPRITQDQFVAALRSTPVTYFLDGTPQGPPDSEPEQVLVRKTLPGYGGPALTTLEIRNLLALGDLIRGGPERDWRLRLLRAECQMGLRQFKAAVEEYGRLLTDPDSGPTKRKFVAIRSGLAHVALGDARYRASRRLDDRARDEARSAYEAATRVMQTHAVSSAHPQFTQIVEYARQQIAKLATRINFLGLQDSIVPVQQLSFLDSEAEERRRAAQDAVRFFEEYRRKADELADVAAELRHEIETAVLRQQVAVDQQNIAATRTRDAELQIEAVSRQQDFLIAGTVLEGVESIFKMAASPPTAGLEIATAGVGVGSALVDFEARRQELSHQEKSAELDKEIAQLQEDIARLEEQIARNQVTFLNDRLRTTQGRNLSQDLYYALAKRFEQLAESHLDVAIRLAYLYERAVAFFLGQPDFVAINDFDFRSPVTGLLGAPAELLGPLKQIREKRATEEAQQDRFTETFSLRAEYPIEFNAFLQTGVMEFALSLYQFERRRPGTHKVRIEDVRVEVRGLVPATGFAGSLTHAGRFLMRDKEATLTEPRPTRLIPTDQQVETELERQRREGTAQAAVGGVIPYAMDPDTIQLDDDTRVETTDQSQEFVSRLLEDYGPSGLWRLAIRDVNPAFIADVFLRFQLKSRETDAGHPGSLEERIEELVAAYENELGGDLDRITAIPLRGRFPDTFDALAAGAGSFLLRAADLHDTGVVVKTVVAQALDADGVGVAGIRLEISKPGTSFRAVRTTGPDGFSEDFSAGPPPVEPPENRPPAEGRWQIRLGEPARFGDLGDLQLFFVCASGRPGGEPR